MNIKTNELILVTVSGDDQPGITSKLMGVISRHGFELREIGQSVTHGLLSLSFLICPSDNKLSSSDGVLKDLLFESKNLNVNLNFKVVEANNRPLGSMEPYILTCISSEIISAIFLKDLSTGLANKNLNIQRIDTMSPEGFHCVALTIQHIPEELRSEIKSDLLNISGKHQVDVAMIRESIYRGNKRLIAFDMDSTLINHEVIDELGEELGIKDQISEITKKAMNGEMDFVTSLKMRVALLKGLDESKLKVILDRLTFTEGTEQFIDEVKKNGYKLAVISGGFTYFANAIKEKLKLDYAFANELEISGGKLTGGLKGTIVSPNEKALLLSLIAQQEKIGLDQVVAIGDGANDLPMLAAAGMGIAFHAKEIVRSNAKHSLSFGPMTNILYFLGLKKFT